jgi:hypothetical protein
MTIYQMIRRALLACTCAAALLACSGNNWRDYSSPEAPYRVMFPEKPSVYKRSIDLDGMKVDMTMTAVDRDGTIFAVGSAQAPDAAKAEAALAAMKTALVKNLGATVTRESSKVQASSASGRRASMEVEANGTQNGNPMKLIGHFEARQQRFYQVIVIGKTKAMPSADIEQFMSSFTLL